MNSLLDSKLFVLFLAPFILGGLTTLGFAPYNITLINFFSFSALLFLISNIKKRTQSKYRKKKSNRYFFYLGYAFSFGFFLFGNYWISISLTHDDMFKDLIPFALILVPLFLSLFLGLAILIVGPFFEKNISFILLFSLSLAVFEFLRGNLFTGFPWNLIAYTWSWSIPSIQILSLIGTYAFNLISISIFCLPFICLQKNFFKRNVILFTVFLLLFVGNYLYGLYKINTDVYKLDNNFIVKIVSPNFTLDEYKNHTETSQLERLIKISAPEKNKKTLFIWPEGIFYESYLKDIKKYENLFSNNFSKNHLIVLGINNFVKSDNSNKENYFNSLVVLNHKLDAIKVYNKLYLVPFGEFLPLEKFFSKFGLKKITRGYNSFTPGNERQIINLEKKFDNKLILPLICYEIIYSGKIKNKDQFPNLVINISEDAWFGESIGPYQHYTKAIFRAVEEGVFIARSANKGISGFIDPNGNSLKFLHLSESGNVEYKMPQFAGTTLFSNYGNKIFFLIILVYIFLILILKKFKI